MIRQREMSRTDAVQTEPVQKMCNLVTGEASDAAYWIIPREGEAGLGAAIQVTFGLNLAEIPRYLNENKKGGDFPSNSFEQFPKLQGLLFLMRGYLRRGLKKEDPNTQQIQEIGPHC